MSLKLAHSIIIEKNGKIEVIAKGTIISEITHVLDNQEETQNVEDNLMSIIQNWVRTYKEFFGKSWNSVTSLFLQPAIDSIQSSDSRQLKDTAIKLAKRIENTENPKIKEKLSLIHGLFTKLLGVARNVFGESVDEIAKILKECKI